VKCDSFFFVVRPAEKGFDDPALRCEVDVLDERVVRIVRLT
jgi:hypothetical protein